MVRESYLTMRNDLYGRTVIYTNADEITKDNIREVLEDAMSVHETNVAQIDYLYEYYRGKTDILNREKTIRSDIVNQIHEAIAKEIVDFKVSYLVGKEIVYSTSNTDISDRVEELNQIMRLCGKAKKDYDLVEWQMIAGTAYRAVFPVEDSPEGEPTFTVTTVDPRQAFVIYSNDLQKEPMACVYFYEDGEGITHYWTYTHDKCFKTNDDDETVETEDWSLHYLPIIEYPANNARLGAFEPVIDLLNAIDTLDSNRLDGVEQIIQALLVLTNCKLPEGETINTLAQKGVIELPSDSANPADIKLIVEKLDQQQTQVLKDDFYEAVMSICAMPVRGNGKSTSDNGLAVIYRDGWTAAETAARTSQKMIESSEFNALRLMLSICRDTMSLDIPLRDIKVDFTTNHYENLELKVQSLIQLLSNDKVHPLTAYEVCGLFADPNEKYRLGMEWYFDQNGEVTDEGSGTDGTDEPSAEV